MRKESQKELTQQPEIVGIDAGGTFTDFIHICPRRGVRAHKESSTPNDPSLAILKGIQQLKIESSFTLVHGTTVATNCFLERTGAKVAWVTTAGFEDLLSIGSQARTHLYDLRPELPKFLTTRALSFGVHERIDSEGNIIEKLTSKEIQKLIQRLELADVEQISLSLLFAFKNPIHEQQLAQALREAKFEVVTVHSPLHL